MIIKPHSTKAELAARKRAATRGEKVHPSESVKLGLVRHGITQFNVDRLYTGCENIDVLPEGLLQAAAAGVAVAKFLSGQGLTGNEPTIGWYMSALWRAQHTMLTLRHAAGLVPLQGVQIVPEFNERDSGVDTGTPVRHGLSVHYVHEGGESLVQAHERAITALTQVISATRPTTTRSGSSKILFLAAHERLLQGVICELIHGHLGEEAKAISVPNAKPIFVIRDESGWHIEQ